MATKPITVDVKLCPHCKNGEGHVDLKGTPLEKPAADGHNYEAPCPVTQQPIPVWHSGFGIE